MENDNTVLTVRDLLHKIFEFISLTPDFMKWNIKSFEENPPRYFRLKEINSLINAFGFYEYYPQTNEFFTIEKTTEIIEQILTGRIVNLIYEGKDITKQEFTKFDVDNKIGLKKIIDVTDLKIFFYTLIAYRTKLDKVINFGRGDFVSSIGDKSAKEIIKDVNQHLLEKVNIIDDTLSSILDPKSQNFARKELVSNYNYPDVDINDVDFDFI